MADIELNTKSDDNKKVQKFAELAEKAAEAIHCVASAKSKLARMEKVLPGDDKQCLWDTRQHYLKEYAAFINGTSFITGFSVNPVDANYYLTVDVSEQKAVRRTNTRPPICIAQ